MAHRRLLGDTLRRRWRILLAGLVLGALLGGAYATTQKPTYQSTMTLIINPLEGNPYSPASVAQRSDANTDTLTEARLASTQAVATLAERALSVPTGSLHWQTNLAVNVIPNTQVIRFTYTASTAARAQAGAEALGEAFLSYRAKRSQDSVTSQLASLDQRSSSVQKDLSTASRRLDASKSRSDRAFLNQQVATYTEQLAAIAAETARLSSASRDPGQVVTPATAAAASGIGLTTLAGAAALLGLLLGIVAAIAREIADSRIHDTHSVEEAGLPVLAHVQTKRRRLRASAQVRLQRSEREQFRVLRAALTARTSAPCSITVSSASATTAVTPLVLGLGEALARSAYDVAMVFATSAPEAEALADGERVSGLADVLLDGCDPRSACIDVVPHLSALLPGERISDAAERFAGRAMKTTLEQLSQSNAYVLVAASPTATADAHTLAAATDHTVIVCELNRSTRGELMQAVRELRRVGSEVLGVVAVDRPRRQWWRRHRHVQRHQASTGVAVPEARQASHATGAAIRDGSAGPGDVAAAEHVAQGGWVQRRFGNHHSKPAKRSTDISAGRPGA